MSPGHWTSRAGRVLGCVLAMLPPAAAGQSATPISGGCEELFSGPGIVWSGTDGSMTLEQLAAYAAPVLWLSPDEPTLRGRRDREIRVPAALPFESQPESPVLYYQVAQVVALPGARGGVAREEAAIGRTVIRFDDITAVQIKYLAYFPEEAGIGQHPHDIEPAEFRLAMGRANGPLARAAGIECDSTDYLIVISRVTGEAHGNPWYYNVLDVGPNTSLPIHLLVEEGKHALATDRNADGYYTPGYDVSARTNDAWGVRDTVSGGTLFSGKFEAWMAKVRRPEHRVLPPLPADSPLRSRLLNAAGEMPSNAVYELRPYPSSSAATDTLLRQKLAEKEIDGWPRETSSATLAPILEAFEEGRELKPFSVAYRYDRSPGLAFAFPLLIAKNVPEPLSGGYLVNRIYLKDDSLRDWGWMLMYTPSASRWFDQYLAAGIDVDDVDTPDARVQSTRNFVAEAGFKFRFRAPNRVFGVITEFWGVRMGVKSVGAMDIENLSYVVEVGAGVW